MARIGNQAYRVRLSEKYYCIHDVVPVLFLKPWTVFYNLKKASFPDLKND